MLVSNDWNLGNFKSRIGNRGNRCSRVYLVHFLHAKGICLPYACFWWHMYIGVSFCICLFILQVFLGPQLLISKFQRTHAFLCRVCNTLTQKIYANNICFLKHSFLARWRQSKQVADILTVCVFSFCKNNAVPLDNNAFCFVIFFMEGTYIIPCFLGREIDTCAIFECICFSFQTTILDDCS